MYPSSVRVYVEYIVVYDRLRWIHHNYDGYIIDYDVSIVSKYDGCQSYKKSLCYEAK